jgi:hypothetical protein
MAATMERRRVHVGGLPQGTAAADLHARFAPFGAVEDVTLLAPAGTGEPRRFAYVALTATDAQWRRCAYTRAHPPWGPSDTYTLCALGWAGMTLYNGAMWRGSKLTVQLAKPDFRARCVCSLPPSFPFAHPVYA